MSWKDDYIAKHGEEAYDNLLAVDRERYKMNPKKKCEQSRAWRDRNPERVIENGVQWGSKGGKYYEKMLEYNRTGLQGERNRIRLKHRKMWRPFKHIIAPDSILHHQWHPASTEYGGVALVDRDAHWHGIIDVIQILEGEITLLTEEEVRRGIKYDS